MWLHPLNVLLLLIVPYYAQDFKRFPDPKLISPTANTTWSAGEIVEIKWDISYRMKDNGFYNPRTRVTVRLYNMINNAPELLYTIAESLPFIYGSVTLGVPNIVLPPKDKRNKFYVVVYPTFFDWPNSCNGCKKNAYRSSFFTILGCSNSSLSTICANKNTSSPVVTYLVPPTDYSFGLYVIQMTAIGIAAFSVLAFTIAFFAYTKQGRKTLQFYKRRRIGMMYKYNPPVVKKGEANQGENVVSPLSTFLNDFKDPTTVDSPLYTKKFGSKLVEPAVDDIKEVDEDLIDEQEDLTTESSGASFVLPQHQNIPVLKMPSSPLETPPAALIAQDSEFNGNAPIVSTSEAQMISNAFRSVLRTSTHFSSEEETFSPVPVRAIPAGSPILKENKWLT